MGCKEHDIKMITIVNKVADQTLILNKDSFYDNLLNIPFEL
jgi:hypothetical protein